MEIFKIFINCPIKLYSDYEFEDHVIKEFIRIKINEI